MIGATAPNDDQKRIAAQLGVDISRDTASIAAARIEDAVSAAIYLRGLSEAATQRQIEFASALGVDVSSDSKRVASAKIEQELFRRNLAALESLELRPGDHVIKRETFEFNGEVHTLEREYQVSSIDRESLRVWFRGGNGQGAWATQLQRIPPLVQEILDEEHVQKM